MNSLLRTPRSDNPASGNCLRACRQRFQTLEKDIQFTKIFADATFATRVTVDVSARWQAHHAQILKEHSFFHVLSNPALFVHVERDIRLLVHGFMVEMPTRKEKCFEEVFSRNTMKNAWRSSIRMATP